MNIVAVSTAPFIKLRDPVAHLTEILCGLSATLLFTLAAAYATSPSVLTARHLLYATLFCNLAWATVEGVMYVVQTLVRRGRMARFVQAYRTSPTDDFRLDVIEKELDVTLSSLVSDAVRGRFFWQVLTHIGTAKPQKVTIERADILGGLVTFWLVFASSLPAVLPFLVISDPWVALRVSNLLVVGLLFATGHAWARYTQVRPVAAGLLFSGLGICLVVAVARLGTGL